MTGTPLNPHPKGLRSLVRAMYQALVAIPDPEAGRLTSSDELPRFFEVEHLMAFGATMFFLFGAAIFVLMLVCGAYDLIWSGHPFVPNVNGVSPFVADCRGLVLGLVVLAIAFLMAWRVKIRMCRAPNEAMQAWLGRYASEFKVRVPAQPRTMLEFSRYVRGAYRRRRAASLQGALGELDTLVD